MRHRARHGWGHSWGPAVVLAAAFALAIGSQGAATALPAKAKAAEKGFASSFEAGDPAPDWLNTVDTAPGGGKRPPASTAATAAASRATSPTM